MRPVFAAVQPSTAAPTTRMQATGYSYGDGGRRGCLLRRRMKIYTTTTTSTTKLLRQRTTGQSSRAAADLCWETPLQICCRRRRRTRNNNRTYQIRTTSVARLSDASPTRLLLDAKRMDISHYIYDLYSSQNDSRHGPRTHFWLFV